MAGLDAGHAYNTFPLMDGRLVPEEYWAMEGWRNAFENTATVQLHHRALALSTLGGVMAALGRLPLAAAAAALPAASERHARHGRPAGGHCLLPFSPEYMSAGLWESHSSAPPTLRAGGAWVSPHSVSSFTHASYLLNMDACLAQVAM